MECIVLFFLFEWRKTRANCVFSQRFLGFAYLSSFHFATENNTFNIIDHMKWPQLKLNCCWNRNTEFINSLPNILNNFVLGWMLKPICICASVILCSIKLNPFQCTWDTPLKLMVLITNLQLFLEVFCACVPLVSSMI